TESNNGPTSRSAIKSFEVAVYYVYPNNHAKERLIHRKNLPGNKGTTTLNLRAVPFEERLVRPLAPTDTLLVTILAMGLHGEIVGYGATPIFGSSS
ncbi:MAG: hypothetical protein AAFP00_18600, partial [Bacteroidota bacterium]